MNNKQIYAFILFYATVVIMIFLSNMARSSEPTTETNRSLLVSEPTATMAIANKTPLAINYEDFIYTTFEMRFRGGSETASCPYRWVSVRATPSTSGAVIGCLAPYSKWNVETWIESVDALVYEGGNVWGRLAMQEGYVALKTSNQVYYTNWHE